MSPILIAIMAVLQLYVAIEQAVKGNLPVAIMFFGYFIANTAYFWLLGTMK